eukprot:8444655-Lingulodinium_polyedra.AAC.1
MPGGAFLYKTQGEAVQVIQSAPRTKAAVEWCIQYGCPKLASFTISKYTEKVATSLALYWANKMQCLYDIYLNQEDEAYQYRPEDVELANYAEDLEEAWKDLPKTHPCWSRVKEIQGIAPA